MTLGSHPEAVVMIIYLFVYLFIDLFIFYVVDILSWITVYGTHDFILAPHSKHNKEIKTVVTKILCYLILQSFNVCFNWKREITHFAFTTLLFQCVSKAGYLNTWAIISSLSKWKGKLSSSDIFQACNKKEICLLWAVINRPYRLKTKTCSKH